VKRSWAAWSAGQALRGGEAVEAGSGSKSGTKNKNGMAAKAVRRGRSATARMRSLMLDDLSRTLASSGLHAFLLPGSSTEEREGERTEEKMTCRLTGGSADDVVG
jgi:hypothetical protein